MMRVWVTFGILSLQASLSLAADISAKVTHSTFQPPEFSQPDFPAAEIDQVFLGRDLFYDPILSGNRNISCATCHSPAHGSSDGLALGLGEGARGMGPDRHALPDQPMRARIPRNAPALWNLGASQFSVMFHDGRVERDRTAAFGIRMPEGRPLERAVSGVLAAQTILPILSPEEMAGAPGENDIADLIAKEHITGPDGAWATLTARISALPAYATRFDRITGGRPLHISDLANAMAAYISYDFRCVNSPYDAYLAGDETALSAHQIKGMELFYGKAGCASCHSGPLQSDQGFHAIGMPQIGPGKSLDQSGADLGRYYVTGLDADRYRFRTPSLRNVTLTAPYGHSGAYATLEGVVRHHLDPMAGLTGYRPDPSPLPPLATADDWRVMENQTEMIEIAAAIELPDVALSDANVAAILDFLAALTDPAASTPPLGAPAHLPSGLPRADLPLSKSP